MTVKDNMLCSKSHEYVYEENGNYNIGLTDYAIEQLGDIVFVELPEVGTKYTKGEIFGTIESVKAASEIYMPVGGTVVEINEQLIEKPELLNEEPFEDMWLIKVSSEAYLEDSKDLLDYTTYKEEVE
ncbi:TPA: glycine cleavage system protein GcvH [Candidatus Avigastranaerophilus faecigallinarum]|nr:glycine cleavage system protein GcvH [Candidatus Avigastranaerophilus faecigallinarum]